MSGVQYPFGRSYEYVAPSTTAQVLGNLGAKGDTLVRLVITVTTSLTGTVSIADGGTSYAIAPASLGVGVYSLTIEADSMNGPWTVTTGAGASVLAIGNFS